MPGSSDGSDHGRARAVGEDERRAAVVEVGDVGEPLDADHQHVLGAAAADHVGGRARRRGRSRRRRRRCRTPAAGVGAELVGDRGGDGRGLQQVRDGRDDDAVDLGRRRCRRARAPCATAATDIICTVSSGAGEAALLDAGALLDPLVAGVDRLDDLGVGDDPARAGRCRCPRIAACGAPADGVEGRSCVDPFGVEADQRLAGGDQVAVLDEPLDDGAAVRRA